MTFVSLKHQTLALIFFVFIVNGNIFNTVARNCDKGKISLFCLDFSFAVDIVDHSLLIQQLETSLGILGFCLEWIFSYLSNRSFEVSMNNLHSTSSFFQFSVAQGYVRGPHSFFYTSELPRIILSFSLQSTSC